MFTLSKKLSIGILLILSTLLFNGCVGQGPCCQDYTAPTGNSLEKDIGLASNVLGGSLVGAIALNDGGCEIEQVDLSGVGSENFNISNNGEVTVAQDATLTPSTTYNLTATVTNCEGSTTIPVTIHTSAAPDTNTTATLTPFANTVCNNATASTSVGNITVSNNGGCAVTGFSLTGSDFDISSAGEITVATGASLTAGSVYNLTTTATNCKGDSNTTVAITVNNCITCNPPLKTGQTASYLANDDGDLQRGTVRDFTRNANDTVTDNVTGLIWQDNNTSAATTTKVSFAGALGVCTALNTASFAGQTDWRLPTINELRTLINYAAAETAYPTTGIGTGVTTHEAFINMTSDFHGHYWSSETNPSNATHGLSIGYSLGKITSETKATTNLVKCVRGDTLSASTFTRNDTTGIVTDSKTCLQWQDVNLSVASNWNDAINYCTTLALDGGDWSLPNSNELYTLTDTTAAPTPFVDSSFVNGLGVTNYYWSSSTAVYPVGDTTNAIYHDFAFNTGAVGVSSIALKTDLQSVRCVRTTPTP